MHAEIDEEGDQNEQDEHPTNEIGENSGNNAPATAESIQKESAPSEHSPAPPTSKRQRRDKLAGLLEQRQKERLEIFMGLTQNQDNEVDLFF